ncbi:PAS domain S-box protein [Pseudoroseomonas cervicalis]|uniref:PAS domain S-box protein n=1 Tax=Teichococcus cervicalis TaxID=204525 RepID=UPI0027836825|nr:PAS domain S-box protein [Pseudoroseomonas cervicalis]MDQ1079646.1 PAS domain S-box-containing protein [Pseudoroseomonas cervicalis]
MAPGAYQGVINISARTQETAGRLRRLLKSPADSLALLLADGGVLVATGAEAVEGGALPAELPPQAVREALRRATPAAPPPRLFRDAEGLAVLQPVPGWDAYAFAARPREQVVARWRGSVGRLLLLGGPAMLALLGLALLVGRGQRRLVEANAGLERRVAERTAALAASEERLRLAQEAAGIGVWELALGAHGRPARPPADRTIWSDQQFRLLGLPPGGPPPGLRALLRRVLPADRMMVLAALRRPPPQPVLRVRLRRFGDGALRWLFLTGQRVAGEGGRPARLIGVATDITERQQSGEALREAEARYRALFDAAPFAVFLFDPATHAILDVNERACRDYGYSAEEFRSLRIGDIDALEQADAIRARGRRHRIGPDVQEFEARHRLRDGALRDVMVRVQGVRLSGRDLSYAAHMDITARKHAEEQRLLLAREVDHRAKNVLALVQAALRLTPKEDAAAYTAAVEGRVMALARAHTLLAQGYWTGAELRDLLEGELAAFLAPAEGAEPGAPRVLLEGPPVTLPPALAQGVSMVLHELATNATKHGALSREGGTVRVAWSVSEEPARLRLRWTERGGPPLSGAPRRAGFGSRMLEATIGRQLGGAVRRDWRPEGLECELELPLPAPQHRDAA